MKSKSGQNELIKIREENVKKNNANNYTGECLAGTTAIVCLITKDDVYVANAGDSRAVGCLYMGKSGKNKAK